MKIAVFTDSFFPSGGGTERAIYNLSRNLMSLGHEIVIFAPDYHREQSFDEFEVKRVGSIKLSHNDMAVLGGYRKVLKRVQEFNPDIIHFCTASGMASMAIKIARKLHKPVVATVHTKFKEAFYNGCKSKLITNILIKSFKRKLDRADRVVAVSKDMAGELNKYGYKGDVKVIRNGFDGFNFEGENNKKIDYSNINFIYCGHLIKVKNIQFSLKSLAILKKEKKFSNFKFILVGEGNYKKKLQKIIKKEALTENIIFKGFIGDRKELAKLYNQSFLLLFPSTYDTDGLVVCEAAREGTPVLTLEGFGSSERITNNENGFTSINNERDFAERIYEIVRDKALYQHVCDNISSLEGKPWIEIAKDYEEMFVQLLNIKKI